MACGKNESIAVNPVWIRRVVAHDSAIKNVSERGERHRCSLVAALRCERTIHCDAANHRNGKLILFGRQRR